MFVNIFNNIHYVLYTFVLFSVYKSHYTDASLYFYLYIKGECLFSSKFVLQFSLMASKDYWTESYDKLVYTEVHAFGKIILLCYIFFIFKSES